VLHYNYCHADCHYDECHNAEYGYAECGYYTECRYDKCCGAFFKCCVSAAALPMYCQFVLVLCRCISFTH
jgi:hypothetical protein